MNDVKLPVLWIDQWGPFANAFRDDCMDASLDMVFHYLNIAGNLTVDDIANLLPPIVGLSVEDGAKIAAWFGVDARVETLTSDSIYAHLDAGRVIIPLLLITDISERQDRGVFQHFWCIIGHTADGSVYVHDPDRLYGTTYGAGLVIPMAEMLQSIADATDVTGKHSQGLVIYGQFPVSIDHVASVKSAGTRVRSAPSLNASIFEGLALSTQVNVLAEAPIPAGSQTDGTYHLWYRCQAPFKGTHIYGWIAGDLLTPISTPEQPVYMYTTTRLNLRSAMALDPANVITVMPTNTRVKVAPGSPGVPGGIPWVSVTTDSGQVGYCSKAYLGPNPTTPLPKPAGSGVLYGPHLMGTQDLVKIGQMPYTIYKSVDNPGALQAAHTTHPSAICIYRNYGLHLTKPWEFINGDIPGAVTHWLAMMNSFIEAMPWAYFESWNETDIHDPAFPVFLAFEAARARAMAAKGWRACLLNISSGVSSATLWLTAKDMVKAAIETGALIGEHCYAEAVMSADYHGSGWTKDHQWQGNLFPTTFDADNAFTGLRCLTDARDLRNQGQGLARLAITELGIDDMSAGVNTPPVKTKGWRTCWDVWRNQGWLTNTTPEAFYLAQLKWWSSIVAQEPMIVGGTIYTDGDDSGKWPDFDVKGVL